MKTLPKQLIMLAAVGLALSADGQGTVNFNNLVLGTTAQVYDDATHGGYLLGSTNYGPGAQGTNWFAQLYAAAGTGVPSAALVPVGQPVNFRGGFGAGYVQTSGTTTLGWKVNSTVTIPFLSPGGPTTLQLRVWWGGGTQIISYEAATASSNPNSRWGASHLFYLASTGNPIASPPTTPADLIGLLYFSIGEIQPARPPVITVQPQSEVAFVGANVFLSAAAVGVVPMSYQWSYDGTSISGATTDSLVLADVQPADVGSYAVRITNADGSTTSSNAVVTVGPPPPCATPPFGLMSWWRAETNAEDCVSGNHGAFHNGAGLGLGKVGHAFDLGGTNLQSVVIPNSDTLNPPSSFSIEGWIYPRHADILDLFTKWESLKLSYAFGIHNRSLFFAICDASHQSDSLFYWFEVPHVWTLNAWAHVAAVYDQPNGIRRLYVNGVQVGVRTNLPITVLHGTASVRIEADGFNGLVDEVSFYNVALSADDIQAIYAAGGVGKCKELAAIVTQPVSQRVNVGTGAQFNVVATGSLTLHYQWLKAGVLLPGATGTSLALANVRDADAGIYSVQVTNWFGAVVSSNALLTVNHAPVADASATVPVVISPNNSNAIVVLNGSRSSDPDGDALQYSWFQAGAVNAFATGIVAVVTLPLGTNSITLAVDDGLAAGTQTINVEVITPEQALERLKARVIAQVPRAQPLVASLSAAMASLDRGNATAAIHQLQAFQQKIRAQVAPTDPALAAQLILAAQEVTDSLDGGSGREHVQLTAIHRQVNGKMRLHFNAKRGPVYVIEVSTNLVDWEKIGVAADSGDGSFEFEDANAVHTPARFYRIVSP